ncbi:MAG TPA: hypothetical protein VJ436_11405 [Anaerolineales bacterium]|nr:hypothetical protein [Anaerolineales bacterium]
MKKFFLIGTLLAVVVLALGVAGLASAQTQTPPTPSYPGYGPGAMGGGRGFGRTMDGFQSGPQGQLHPYMISAFAEALEMDPADLQTRLDAGETLAQIAAAEGLSQEAIGELWIQARTEALNQAVADGVITQAQADWMIERMAQRQAAGYGPGSAACDGSGPAAHGRRGAGRRWNTP